MSIAPSPVPADQKVALSDFETLSTYTDPVPFPDRPIVGREKEVTLLLSSMKRPVLRNAILLAPPGVGKTAVVSELARQDTSRIYLEVNLSRMIASTENADQMGNLLKVLFEEAAQLSSRGACEIVLFIDEFHQVVQLSAAAVEALKPLLAKSGSLGMMLIAATTEEEFNLYVMPNQALVERLQRIKLSPPGHRMVLEILRGATQTYGVATKVDDVLLNQIVELTNRHNPAAVQPRKSLNLLDALIGKHLFTGREIDKELLSETLAEVSGIDVSSHVEPRNIERKINEKIYGQAEAASVIQRRLQIVVADLHDKSKPLSSFIFAGATGVGKTEMCKRLTTLMFGEVSQHFVRFDMSEYSQVDSLVSFRRALTEKVWNAGHAVVMFDEIEKASGEHIRLLLQVLDDGRLSDINGRQVSFLNCYLVMTTNAGSNIFESIGQHSADNDGTGENMKEYAPLIRQALTEVNDSGTQFPPELLGRVDVVVPFQPLTDDVRAKIVASKLGDLRDEVYRLHGVLLKIDGKVQTLLLNDLDESSSKAGGARRAIATMTNTVTAEVAIFLNSYPKERKASVVVTGQMVAQDKTRRVSTARVEVHKIVA